MGEAAIATGGRGGASDFVADLRNELLLRPGSAAVGQDHQRSRGGGIPSAATVGTGSTPPPCLRVQSCRAAALHRWQPSTASRRDCAGRCASSRSPSAHRLRWRGPSASTGSRGSSGWSLVRTGERGSSGCGRASRSTGDDVAAGGSPGVVLLIRSVSGTGGVERHRCLRRPRTTTPLRRPSGGPGFQSPPERDVVPDTAAAMFRSTVGGTRLNDRAERPLLGTSYARVRLQARRSSGSACSARSSAGRSARPSGARPGRQAGTR